MKAKYQPTNEAFTYYGYALIYAVFNSVFRVGDSRPEKGSTILNLNFEVLDYDNEQTDDVLDTLVDAYTHGKSTRGMGEDVYLVGKPLKRASFSARQAFARKISDTYLSSKNITLK